MNFSGINIRTMFIIISIFALIGCGPKGGETSNMESDTSTSKTLELLVGTYTNKESKGLYRVDFEPISGVLSNAQLVAESNNPSFLTIDQQRQYVFVVNEGDEGMVSSFKWNDERNALTLVSQQSTLGASPCHIDLHPDGNLLAIANYSSGNVIVFKLDDKGVIQPDPVNFQHQGGGPVLPNQQGPRAHCVKFDSNGQFLYAVDLGIDQIVTYPVHSSGTVSESTSSVSMDPGDGPRHIIFQADKDLAFVVNELSSSVVSMKIDHLTGQFERIDKKSTLPDDFTGKNYCADIQMTRDGRYVYASNRGHHSIAIFSVSDDGKLTSLGIEPVRGEWPRNFTLSPDEKYLLAANQNTDNITVFEVNPETGLLTFTGKEIQVSRPVALKF